MIHTVDIFDWFILAGNNERNVSGLSFSFFKLFWKFVKFNHLFCFSILN